MADGIIGASVDDAVEEKADLRPHPPQPLPDRRPAVDPEIVGRQTTAMLRLFDLLFLQERQRDDIALRHVAEAQHMAALDDDVMQQRRSAPQLPRFGLEFGVSRYLHRRAQHPTLAGARATRDPTAAHAELAPPPRRTPEKVQKRAFWLISLTT